MKKLAGILGACALMLSLAACGDQEVHDPANTGPSPTPTSHVTPLPPVTSEEPTLVPPLPPVTEEPSLVPPMPPVTEEPKPTFIPPATEQPPATPIKPVEPSPSSPPPTKSKPEVKKIVALTFDDGPTPYSLEILKILQEKEVPATFYETGIQVKQYPEISKKLHESGMSVQSHSWRHADLTKLSSSELKEDLAKSFSVIEEATGSAPKCVRPPYGATNERVKAAIQNKGAEVSLWNVDSLDWTVPGTSKIKNEVLNTLKPESVILMHDGVSQRDQTVEALPGIIDELKNRGYSFVLACDP